MRTANPALNDKTFESFGAYSRNLSTEQSPTSTMTINGTVHKTMFLLLLAMGTACFTWTKTFSIAEADPSAAISSALPWAFGGAIVGFIVAMVICFKHTWAPTLAPVYALAEGLFLGGISATFEAQYPGIVIQAVGGTFGTLFGLLLAYQSGLIRATENFKLGIVAATGGICLVYLISMIGGFFGMPIPLIHDSGLFGIGFSLFVVVIAALNLVLDFDFIEQAAERGAPKYLEWYGAFALMVTLVWLYLEILRLLSKLRSRN
ncbi:MAG: Bax inhibitor-1/YccA family protein [Planctomycetia bacterium]|nr:Bax inhibitor-1/YccA family protein [Planctomycetia bacterium]